MKQIKIQWQDVFSQAKSSNYLDNALFFVNQQKNLGKVIFPPNEIRFNAFKLTPYHKVGVVILGQDPYHGEGQANGLAFSVNPGVKVPPSLSNIYKEIKQDIGYLTYDNGDLTPWAKQGVLLLNTVLSVEQSKAHSHKNIGWEVFTDEIIKSLNHSSQPIVFLLWGKFAQKKAQLINNSQHVIFNASHPSPLSEYRGFIGCKHFSLTNKIRIQNNQAPIIW